MEREEFRDLGVQDDAELSRIKAEVSASSLYNEDLAPTGPVYNYGLFFTFFVAGLAYLLLNVIPGLAPQPRREPEAT